MESKSKKDAPGAAVGILKMEKSKKGLNRDELNQKFERIKSNLNMLSNQGKERIVFENDDRMNELYT